MEPLAEPIKKISLNVFEADYEALRRMYGTGAVGEVIRELIRKHVKEQRHEHSR